MTIMNKNKADQMRYGVTGMPTVEVEIDIFSGMPNPSWTLTETDAVTFLSKFNELHETEEKSLANNLGYRGFIIRIRQGLYQELHIQNGVVSVVNANKFLIDPNRSLERWLLETGRSLLSKEISMSIDTDLKH